MKILLSSHAFAPSIGGIETCSFELARALTQMGHEVQVITQTPATNPADDHGLKVWRRPSKWSLIRAVRWCDVYFQNNISLQTAWPIFFIRRPWVVCTQTWLKNADGSMDSGGKLKQRVLRLATNVYISRAIRDHVGYPGVMIPNPYNDNVFRVFQEINRERSLVFLGRLVSDKGCDLLIQALAQLRDEGMLLPLTIIGSGPEESVLKQLVAFEKLGGQVHFVGALRGEALARELNRHQVLVVPSRWEEPFGIVALEGIACGCLVVGSSGGGLPDAIGTCGVTFKNGDAGDLARAVRDIIENQGLATHCRQAMPSHLHLHQAQTVAGLYLEIFKKVCHNL